MVKAFKSRFPKPSLVGSRQLSARYTGGWESPKVVGDGVSKSFEVRDPYDLVL